MDSWEDVLDDIDEFDAAVQLSTPELLPEDNKQSISGDQKDIFTVFNLRMPSRPKKKSICRPKAPKRGIVVSNM